MTCGIFGSGVFDALYALDGGTRSCLRSPRALPESAPDGTRVRVRLRAVWSRAQPAEGLALVTYSHLLRVCEPATDARGSPMCPHRGASMTRPSTSATPTPRSSPRPSLRLFARSYRVSFTGDRPDGTGAFTVSRDGAGLVLTAQRTRRDARARAARRGDRPPCRGPRRVAARLRGRHRRHRVAWPRPARSATGRPRLRRRARGVRSPSDRPRRRGLGHAWHRATTRRRHRPVAASPPRARPRVGRAARSGLGRRAVRSARPRGRPVSRRARSRGRGCPLTTRSRGHDASRFCRDASRPSRVSRILARHRRGAPLHALRPRHARGARDERQPRPRVRCRASSSARQRPARTDDGSNDARGHRRRDSRTGRAHRRRHGSQRAIRGRRRLGRRRVRAHR